MKRLLDSGILIDHFNAIAQATTYLKTCHNDCCISVITRAEVLNGFDEDNSFSQAEQLLKHFQLIELDRNITDLVIQLRREQRKKSQLNSQLKRLYNGNCPMVFKRRSLFIITSNSSPVTPKILTLINIRLLRCPIPFRLIKCTHKRSKFKRDSLPENNKFIF
jgi:predicted nucleic acid-binding protein